MLRKKLRRLFDLCVLDINLKFTRFFHMDIETALGWM
jgi:hypothetical protein